MGIGVFTRDPPSKLSEAAFVESSIIVRAKDSLYRAKYMTMWDGRAAAVYDMDGPHPRFSGWGCDPKRIQRIIRVEVRQAVKRKKPRAKKKAANT